MPTELYRLWSAVLQSVYSRQSFRLRAPRNMSSLQQAKWSETFSSHLLSQNHKSLPRILSWWCVFCSNCWESFPLRSTATQRRDVYAESARSTSNFKSKQLAKSDISHRCLSVSLQLESFEHTTTAVSVQSTLTMIRRIVHRNRGMATNLISAREQQKESMKHRKKYSFTI